MGYRILVGEILGLDPRIDYALVIDNEGNIISSSGSSTSKRNLSDSELDLAMFEISLMMKMVMERERSLGSLLHIQITHEKTGVILFPLEDEHTLVVLRGAPDSDRNIASDIASYLRGPQVRATQ